MHNTHLELEKFFMEASGKGADGATQLSLLSRADGLNKKLGKL